MAEDAKGQKQRAIVRTPEGNNQMTPEEERQVELQMAKDLQRQLGIEASAGLSSGNLRSISSTETLLLGCDGLVRCVGFASGRTFGVFAPCGSLIRRVTSGLS